MSFAVALLSLGLLVGLGSVLTVAAAGRTPTDAVPACCRRRVEAFARRARVTVLAGVLAALVGAAFLSS
ncbi:hypothetical protein [Modestobacter lapidis]|nr:hypothetical protein [Modestobacter lapidis]